MIGGSFDPIRVAKNLYYDLPKAMFKGGKSPFNVSINAGTTKILGVGHRSQSVRTGFYEGPAVTVTGGRIVTGSYVRPLSGGTAIGLGLGGGLSISGGYNSKRLFTSPIQW
jgi:hypothetical protein